MDFFRVGNFFRPYLAGAIFYQRGNYRFKSILNSESLLPYNDENGGYAGRFELYKTQNMYNFILLDTETGSTWQVQWGNADERQVIRIW